MTRHYSHHGLTYSAIYRVWAAMKSRCTNPKDPSWPRYGGRGIKLWTPWNSFEYFLEDMGKSYRKGLWIERIDNNKGYWPSNVRWATRAEQDRNKRSNHNLTFQGVTMCFGDWARKIGISRSALRARLERKSMTFEEAMTMPRLENRRAACVCGICKKCRNSAYKKEWYRRKKSLSVSNS